MRVPRRCSPLSTDLVTTSQSILHALLIILLCIAFRSAHSDIVVAKPYSESEQRSLTISGFSSATSGNADLKNQIAQLLRQSGRFNINIDPVSRHTDDGDIKNKFTQWDNSDIDYVLIGKAQQMDDQSLQVDATLVKRDGQRNLFANRYTIEEQQVNPLARTISNEIYTSVTGKDGLLVSRFAFVSQGEINSERRSSVYLSDRFGDDRHEVLVINAPHAIISPAFSPDGNSLIYISTESAGEYWLVTHDLASTERRKTYSAGNIISGPAWSPDGSKIAFSVHSEDAADIYTIDSQNGKLHRLTNASSMDIEPSWVDNKSLLFTSDRSGSRQIYHTNLETAENPTVLTKNGPGNFSPFVAPNRRGFAFVHTSRNGSHIAYQDFRSGTVRVLSSGKKDQTPAISPDSQFVAYTDGERDNGDIGVIAIDESYQYFIRSRPNEKLAYPAWSSQ